MNAWKNLFELRLKSHNVSAEKVNHECFTLLRVSPASKLLIILEPIGIWNSTSSALDRASISEIIGMIYVFLDVAKQQSHIVLQLVLQSFNCRDRKRNR